jgi:hypothetical protein
MNSVFFSPIIPIYRQIIPVCSGTKSQAEYETNSTLLGKGKELLTSAPRRRRNRIKHATPQKVKDDNFFRLMFAMGVSENINPQQIASGSKARK